MPTGKMRRFFFAGLVLVVFCYVLLSLGKSHTGSAKRSVFKGMNINGLVLLNSPERARELEFAKIAPTSDWVCAFDTATLTGGVWKLDAGPDTMMTFPTGLAYLFAAWSPDSKLLALVTDLQKLQVYDVQKQITKPLWDVDSVSSGVWSHDSSKIACLADTLATVSLLDAMTGRKYEWMPPPSRWPYPAVAWAHMRAEIALIGGGELRVLDVETATVKRTITTDPVNLVSYDFADFSPTDDLIVCRGFNHGDFFAPVSVYDMRFGAKVFDIQVQGPARVVAWSPSGRYIAIGAKQVGRDFLRKGLVILDANSWKPVASLQAYLGTWVAARWDTSERAITLISKTGQTWRWNLDLPTK